MAKCDPMALKYLFFQNITKNRPTAGGFAPRPPKPPAAGGPAPKPPLCETFQLPKLFQHVPKVRYLHFSTISLSLLLLQNRGYVQAGNNNFRSSMLRYLCPTKTSSLEKI